MFCPKCGTQTESNQLSCSNCGFNFSEVEMDNIISSPTEKSEKEIADVTNKPSINFSLIRIIVFSFVAVVVLIMFFIAASKIAKGGLGIMDIQSVGGKTLEEAYYFQLGSIYAGYATVVRAMGIFFASILVSFGFRK